MVNPRLIKKYKNRRLYDLETSKFITIDDLQRFVIEGLVFQVVDAGSGKDITNATLLQIFVEMDVNSAQFFSSDMLRQLIVMAHHPMNKGFKSMLENMMQTMNNQLVDNLYPNDYQKTADAWSKQTQELLSQWQGMFRK